MFNVPIVVVYMLSLCFFSSISLFYALFFQFNLLVLCFLFFVLLCFCVLCFISSNYIVLYVTLFQCHAWGFISAMELVGHSRVDSSMPLQMVPVGWV